MLIFKQGGTQLLILEYKSTHIACWYPEMLDLISRDILPVTGIEELRELECTHDTSVNTPAILHK